jgi:hypothetical protein
MKGGAIMTNSLVVLGLWCVMGAPQPEGKGKVDPPGAPLEARLVVKKAEYVLDRMGQTAEQYQKTATTQPPLVDVDLVLELRNTGDRPITIWVTGDYRHEKPQAGGDYVTLTLDLKGPGAASATVRQRDTAPATPPPALGKIEPGKTWSLPITSLAFGTHGVATFVAQRACWTEPGEYTLTATYKTAVSPAPPGSKETKWAHFEGGFATVTSPPVKLKVVEKKP